jgi:dipeptidyl aminopeptidase/acylaminoacyl peptidase
VPALLAPPAPPARSIRSLTLGALALLLACGPNPAAQPRPRPLTDADQPTPSGPAPAGPTEPAPAGDIISPPESLRVEGVPPVPSELAEALAPYAEIRAANALGWHPSGDRLLISTRFADTPQLHQLRAPGGARTQLTFFRDKVSVAAYPPVGDGDYLVFNKDRGGDEFGQNWRLDLATGALTLLSDGGARSKNTLGIFSRDGQRLVYTSTRRTGQDTDLYVVDPRRPESDRMLTAVTGGGWAPLDWSPDGGLILVQEYISVARSHLWLVDSSSGEQHRLTPESDGQPVAWVGGAFTADGRAVITTTDGGVEHRMLVRLDLNTHELRAISGALPWDVEGFALSRDGARIAALTNEGGPSHLHLYDGQTLREEPISTKLPEGVISGLHWHPQGQRLAFTVSSARSPADVWSFDPASGEATRWTESEAGGLVADTFVVPEPIRWKSFDEREIPGFYYRPPPRFTGPRPALIIIHGGPEAQSRVGFIGRNNYFLNELGVALIYPNVRGSTGYGKSYVRLDDVRQREDAVADIGALLDWITAQPELDAGRVVIMGGSYGGYMTLAASARYADRIRGGVDIVGISNFVSFLENTEAYRRDLRRVEYGDERDPQIRAFLGSISPLHHADKIKRPLLVIQGRNDPRVPASEAEQIVKTLAANGAPAWYIEANDEGHGFAKKRNQDYQMYATVLFLRRYLLDESF